LETAQPNSFIIGKRSLRNDGFFMTFLTLFTVAVAFFGGTNEGRYSRKSGREYAGTLGVLLGLLLVLMLLEGKDFSFL